MADFGLEASNIASTIATLKQRMQEAVDAQDYVLAAKIRDQIGELAKSQQEDMVNMQKSQYNDECRRIEQQYELELERFNRTWEERLLAFENKARAKRDELEIEYNYELKNGESAFQRAPVKFSAALLNLREKQISAGRTGHFEEAIILKREADAMEAEEIQAHEKLQDFLEQQGSEPIHKRFEIRKNSLEQRIEAGKVDIMTRWAADLEALQKHFEALKRHEANKIFTTLNPKQRMTLDDTKNHTSQLKQTIKTAKSPLTSYIKSGPRSSSRSTSRSGSRACTLCQGAIPSSATMTPSRAGSTSRARIPTSTSTVERMRVSKASPGAASRTNLGSRTGRMNLGASQTVSTPGRIGGVSPSGLRTISP